MESIFMILKDAVRTKQDTVPKTALFTFVFIQNCSEWKLLGLCRNKYIKKAPGEFSFICFSNEVLDYDPIHYTTSKCTSSL